uniref:Uncharacterized protein n=1 Tax=Compsopogon caeruleus TaxID=31354 RepID=A0A7S1XGI0_9RHOD|mmetsp:Transcript_7070/g.14574  ORF Transcript_7070/g.14574 Transcript_7070/m.14574 type:complete len:177 (+) Transcript_7070:141-671(+)
MQHCFKLTFSAERNLLARPGSSTYSNLMQFAASAMGVVSARIVYSLVIISLGLCSQGLPFRNFCEIELVEVFSHSGSDQFRVSISSRPITTPKGTRVWLKFADGKTSLDFISWGSQVTSVGPSTVRLETNLEKLYDFGIVGTRSSPGVVRVDEVQFQIPGGKIRKCTVVKHIENSA